jgi:hypothetical protein
VLATSLVEEAAHYIGRAITDVSALLDPRLIVLSASAADHEALLLRPVNRFLEDHAPRNRGVPRTSGSALGSDLPVIGAAMLALRRIVSEPVWYLAPVSDRSHADIPYGGADGLKSPVVSGGSSNHLSDDRAAGERIEEEVHV